MTTKLHQLLTAILLLTVLPLQAANPPAGSGCGTSPGDCYECEDGSYVVVEGDPYASEGECELFGYRHSTHSFEWALNLGYASWSPYPDLTGLYAGNVVDPGFYKPGAKRSYTMVSAVVRDVYSGLDGKTRRYPVNMYLSVFNVRDAADPKNLSLPGFAKVQIDLTDYSKGGNLGGVAPTVEPPAPGDGDIYATVSSESGMATVTYRAGGYDVDVYSVVDGNSALARRYEFRSSEATGSSGGTITTFTLTNIRTPDGSSPVTSVHEIVETVTDTGGRTVVATDYLEGQDRKKQTITYSDIVGGDNGNDWPDSWTAERVVEERADTTNNGQTGAYTVVSHSLEKYEHRRRIATPQQNTTEEGQPVVTPATYEPKSHLTRRLTELTLGYGTANPRTITYDYNDYDDGDMLTSTGYSNPFIHGRPKAVNRPDGTWSYYEYTGGQSSPIKVATKYSSYLGVPISQKEMARKEVSVVAGNTTTTHTYLGGVLVARDETVETSQQDGGKEITISNWTGADWETADGKLTSTTSYHDEDSANSTIAGRPKWTKHSDGTYTVYSYSSLPNNGYTITEDTGAGNETAITDGTRTVTSYNSAREVTAQSSFGITAGTAIAMSSMAAQTFDHLGRPTEIHYNGNSADKELREYSCCGLSLLVDRSGARTEYFYNAARRAYRTISKRSNAGTPVTTTTLRDGLTTTTTRTDGTTTLLISSSTSALNGDMVSSTSADSDGNTATDETTSYAYSYPGDSGHPAGEGIKTTVTMPDGSTSVRHTYLDGRVKSVSGSAVADMDYTYGTHNLAAAGSPAPAGAGGETTTVSYAGTSQTTTNFTDALGRTFKVQYDTGVNSTMSYNSSSASAGSRGKLASSTDPDGITTTYAYNTKGERTTTTQQTAGGTRITTTETDAVDNSVSGIGNAWRTRAWVEGQGTAAQPQLLVSTSYSRGDGYQSKSVSLSGTSTSTRTVPADGAWTVTSTNPDGTQSRQFYEDGLMDTGLAFENGSTLPTSAPADITAVTDTGFISGSSRTHDAYGRLLTTIDSRTGTSSVNGYTESGQPTDITATDETTTFFTYDIMGRRIAVDAPNTGGFDNITHTSYYPTGQVKAVWGAQTYPRYHVYDEQNRLIALHTYNTAPTGEPAGSGSSVTTWDYNPTRGWLDRKEYDDGKGTNYTYTDAGRLSTRAWAREVTTGTPVTTTYGYTAGQLTSVSYNDTITPAVTYTYDSLGRVLTADNTVSANSYAYNATNLTLSTETVTVAGASSPLARTITRHYDSLLRPAGMELKDGTTVDNAVSYGYDTAGRLQSLAPSYPLPATPDFTYNYQPNTYNLVQSVTGPAHTVTNAWETDRNVLGTKTNADLSSTPVIVSAYDYTVNNIGQRESLATSGTAFNSDFRTLDWDYDALGQVIAEADSGATPDSRAFEFDAIGNRKKSADSLTLPTSDNYAVNALNQYTAVQLASSQLVPAYDDDGNLLDDAGINTGTNGDRNYLWDAENRLIEVKDESDGTTIATYAYDYLGRRVRKTVTSGEDTVFLYDGWNVIAEYNVTSTPTLGTTYTWGMDLSGSMQGAGGVGGLLAVNNGTNTFYPTYDGNGNVSEYLNASGANIAHYEYDAFGNIVKATGDSEDFRYRFSTKPLDEEIGWYYYGYRYYDPQTGRWPSRDPIEEAGGISLYGFVGNDGVNYYDLLGLEKVEVDWQWGTEGRNKGSVSVEFIDCTDEQKTMLKKAISRVAVAVDQAVSEHKMEYYLGREVARSGSRAKYFGDKDRDEGEFTRVLYNIETALRRNTIKVECNKWQKKSCFYFWGEDVIAETNSRGVFNFWNIHKYPVFDEVDPREQATTFLHELTHRYGNTKDYGYHAFVIKNEDVYYDTKDGIMQLDPWHSARNADTYAWWMRENYIPRVGEYVPVLDPNNK